MSTLEEQVAAIKERDRVTARFSDSWNDGQTVIVSGTVYNPLNGQLVVGGQSLTKGTGEVASRLLSIESHVPAKPPVPPEPPIDSMLLDVSNVVWRKRPASTGEAYWTNIQGGALGAWLWSNPGMHRHGPFIVYRPEPSPQHIDELVTEFVGYVYVIADSDDWDEMQARRICREFAGNLLRGES